MRGKWMIYVRRTHLFLSVFFSPLLLMFIITGWWQTVTSDDDKEADGGFLHELMKKLSTVHTDSKFPMPNVHHSPWLMKDMVVAMCIALIISIALGLFLSWKMMKSKWVPVAAFVLGILVPVAVLYFI
jgi:ABC-type phosphate/phosphonate transport system permease subunit